MWLFIKKNFYIAGGFTAVGFLLMSFNVHAGENENTAVLNQLLSGEPTNTAQFTTQFLEAVPIEQLNAILADITTRIGPVSDIISNGDEYEITTLTHTMAATIVLNADKQIMGLFFRPPVPLDANLPDLLSAFEQIEGKVSYLILQGDKVLAQKNSDTSLAIGSAFKLAVLKVLLDEIEAGNRQWDDVITLREGLKSLPGGILQDYPDGSPLTLHMLVSLMISISDNSATDMLIDLLGREKVGVYLNNQYVLTTREFFQLKDDADLAAKFANGDKNTKQNISEQLKELDLPSPGIGAIAYRSGVEWYLSAKALCELIASVSKSDVFTINPGLARPNAWADVAFKGGSEVGVMNLTTWVQAKDGTQYCAAVTINNSSALPETEIFSAYGALLEHLAR